MYEVVVMCRARNASLAKKGRAIGNEILTEKIVFEKVKLEESEEQKNLHRLEQELESAQKVLNFFAIAAYLTFYLRTLTLQDREISWLSLN